VIGEGVVPPTLGRMLSADVPPTTAEKREKKKEIEKEKEKEKPYKKRSHSKSQSKSPKRSHREGRESLTPLHDGLMNKYMRMSEKIKLHISNKEKVAF